MSWEYGFFIAQTQWLAYSDFARLPNQRVEFTSSLRSETAPLGASCICVSPVSAGGRRNVQGLPKHYARVGSLPRSGDFRLYAEITMTEPDKDKRTEVELEHQQRKRLMDMFELVRTYDDREAVIAFCENIVSRGSVG